MSNIRLIVVGETNIQERSVPEKAFTKVAPELKHADVLVGHMEGLLYPPSQDPAQPDAPYKPGWRHSDPTMIEAFKAVGFNAVSCASNVSYGVNPILSTIEHLKDAQIAFAGIGTNKADAHTAATFECRGVRFALLGYTSVFWPHLIPAGDDTPGAATVKVHTSYQPGRRALEMPGAPPLVVTKTDSSELNCLLNDINRYRDHVDILICSFHWGISSEDHTVDYQREIAHSAIDAGADMILGHHPHVIQAVEVYNQKPVFYSLGNFAFDWWKMRDRNLDGIALQCKVIDKTIQEIKLLPSRRDRSTNDVEWLNENDEHYHTILTRLERLSIEEFGSFPGKILSLQT